MGAAPCCKAHEGERVGYISDQQTPAAFPLQLQRPVDEPEVARSSSDSAIQKIKKRSERASQRAAQNLPKNGEELACLTWHLSPRTHATASSQQLLRLHEHIAKCAGLVGATVLVNEASFGVLVGPAKKQNMNDADAMLRFGQLLCRWAVGNNLGIRVGAHVGAVHAVQLPDIVGQHLDTDGGMPSASKVAYFGTACAHAVELAASSEKECVLHLSSDMKSSLDAFRQVCLTVSTFKTSYYLEPSTSVDNYFDMNFDRPWAAGPTHQARMVMDISMSVSPLASVGGEGRMSMEDFVQYLAAHKVDVSRFGKGCAKTIEEFYQSVIKEQKAVLEAGADGKLLRHLHLARISLRIRDSQSRLRELRVASQHTSGGGILVRDQPLAFVLRSTERDQWMEAVQRGLGQKLGLSSQVQKNCFAMDQASYHLTEDRSLSETIPGVATVYRAHNVIINVKDKTSNNLHIIGLPEGTTFSRVEDGSGRDFTFNWSPLASHEKEQELVSMLQQNGVDVTEFAPQAFGELYDEVYEQSLSVLEVQNGKIVRRVRVLKVWLRAQVLNVDHNLVVKAKWQRGQFDEATKDQPVSMRMGASQHWRDGVEEALFSRLGLTREFQSKFVTVHASSHRVSEEVRYSIAFPGIETLYMINEVMADVTDSAQAACQLIGLPSGVNFSICRTEKCGGAQNEDAVVTHWCWKHSEGMRDGVVRDGSQRRHLELTDGDEVGSGSTLRTLSRQETTEGVVTQATSVVSREEVFKRRVPKQPSLKTENPKDHPSSPVLATIMAGKKTNWSRAKNAAKRIRDPGYSCKHFFEDIIAAFPELQLYCISSESETEAVSSGRTSDDEFQRTIGALFAVFWMMRLDMGGKESFCFGVSSPAWTPRSLDGTSWTRRHLAELPTRQAFFEQADWMSIQRLVTDAGLMTWKGKTLTHNEDHVLAMLVLMAIHDIMKLTPLLPRVRQGVAEFCGIKTGEYLNDHDEALSYILVHHPELFPSFAGLSKSQQELIKFAHCKMEYNMGWLVQAEAPPGALFRTFRQVAATGKYTNKHVAFYLMHWFADLAGAEPCPLEGCEKFVLKFPLKVLCRFLESFIVVQTLATRTETEVLEKYLIECWTRHQPSLGEQPSGAGAVAKLRFVLMAQGDSQEIISSFSKLPRDDHRTLSQEMACTGCRGQQFQVDSLAGTPSCGSGPAILVYYAPALLQKAGKANAKGTLMVLAEVFRRTRDLWPLHVGSANETVTVRIDVLKEHDYQRMVQPEAGQVYVLCKQSSKDAMVKLASPQDLQSFDWSSSRILTLGAY